MEVTASTQTDDSSRNKEPKLESGGQRRVNGCAVKSLVEQCSAVLLKDAQDCGDLLNEAVFKNINKHCSKRFSRVVLLSASSKALRKDLQEHDREIAELKKKVKEMGKVIVGYENAEWVLKELGKTPVA